MMAWGMNVTATKLLVTHFTPVTMTALRILTAGIGVFIILFFLKQVRLPSRQECLYIVFGGLLNVVGHQYFLSMGFTQTSASNAGLILGTGPLLTAILAAFFLGSTITFVRLLGIGLGIAGISFIVLEGNGGMSGISIGDVYVFVSIFLQAASFIIIKRASTTLDPRLMTGYMLIMGAVILFLMSLFLEPDGLKNMKEGSAGIWIIFFASAILATALGHMMYNYAIGKIGAAETAIFINLNPLFALIGAVVFLGEQIVPSQIIGFILILFGVVLGSGSFEELFHTTKRNKVMKDA
jgi:drug/metabolite transporter (DMT)-like permease